MGPERRGAVRSVRPAGRAGQRLAGGSLPAAAIPVENPYCSCWLTAAWLTAAIPVENPECSCRLTGSGAAETHRRQVVRRSEPPPPPLAAAIPIENATAAVRGDSFLTAAVYMNHLDLMAYSCNIPIENPYCSCKLTRPHGLQLQYPYREPLLQLQANTCLGTVSAPRCRAGGAAAVGGGPAPDHVRGRRRAGSGPTAPPGRCPG